MKLQRSSNVLPGARLVLAMAPALTMGLVRPSAWRSMPAKELKPRPVAFMPILALTARGPSRSHTRANRNGLETLMMVNSVVVSPVS